ncbi:hypothetical protein ACUXV3_12385 [Roseobacteraceae bacterium NS-SX3]
MSEWTGDMADVAAICGDHVARALCQRLAGIVLYVPKKARDRGPVAELPPEVAESLIASFGGDTIYIPSQRPSYMETFKAIEALVDKGLTVQQIALRLGYTEAWIRRCRSKAGAPSIPDKPDPRQLPLF